MIDETVDQDPVDTLAAEFVERQRNGEFPSIETYAEQYPQYADDIRELFPMIAQLERLKAQKSGSSNGRAASGLPMTLTQLGDFRIIREVGRGGMGVVYEAEQLSLKRHVALKVLGANIAGSRKQLLRFQREAEAAARLHHTNIVPVFGIGEEHGIHFFAMQLIDGIPISEIIEYRRQESLPGAVAAGSLPSGDSVSRGVDRGRRSLPGDSVTETIIDNSSDDAAFSSSASHGRVTLLESSAGNALPQVLVSPGGELEPGGRTLPPEIEGWNDVRDAARIAASLADALAYAHAHGVLHRDIKPANVMLDHAGGIFITDFGLARHEDHGGLTNSGDVVGTLRYMAPEQFHGQTDNRADIYGLGLTLYEMLAARPAFLETQQGPLIQQKSEHKLPSLRTLNPSVPRDLETVVMKACSGDPELRYQSARAFREDLQRYLSDRPILARRANVAERAWRWVRKNRIITTLGTLSLLLLAATAVTFAIGEHRTKIALNNADEARATADRERVIADAERLKADVARRSAEESATLATLEAERAENNMQLAITAFDEIIANISSRGVPHSLAVDVEGQNTPLDQAVVTAADAQLLTSLLRFFDRFAEENQTNLSAETADARRRIGDIQVRLGKPDEAELAYQDALDTYLQLEESHPDEASFVIKVAETWNQIGVARSHKGNLGESIRAHFTAGQTLLASDSAMDSDVGRFELASTSNLLGSAGFRTGTADILVDMMLRWPDDGRGRYRGRGRSNGDREEGSGPERDGGPRGERPPFPGGTRPDGPPPERFVEPPREGPGGPPFDFFGSAVEILTELVASHPENSEYRLALARSYRNRTFMPPHRRRGRGDEEQPPSDSGAIENREVPRGSESFAAAVELLDALVDDFPDDPNYRYELADTLCMIGPGMREYNEQQDIAIRLDRAIQIATELVESHPNAFEYQALLGGAHRKLAAVLMKRDQIDIALMHYSRAIELEKPLADRFHEISLYQVAYAQALAGEAEALDAFGDLEGAAQSAELAHRVATASLERRPGEIFVQRFVDQLEQSAQRYRSRMRPEAETLPTTPSDESAN